MKLEVWKRSVHIRSGEVAHPTNSCLFLGLRPRDKDPALCPVSHRAEP